MSPDAELSRARAFLGMLLGSQSDEDRAMIVGGAYQIPDEEILAVTDQMADELVGLDDEVARISRKGAGFIVRPMLASNAPRWQALGCRIGERFLEQDIGWELDPGPTVVLALAGYHLDADPPRVDRALQLLRRLDVADVPLRDYMRAWAAADRLPPAERLWLASTVARALVQAERYLEASSLAEEALTLADEQSDLLRAVALALLLVDCARHLSDDEMEQRYGRLAVDRWESVRQDPDARDDESLARLHDQLAFLHRMLAQRSIASGDVVDAFDMVLRMRGRVLAEVLAVQASPPSRRVPAALWRETQEAWVARDGSGLDEDQVRFDDLIERVRAHDPVAARILDLQSPSVGEVAANLEPGCALVMFVPLPDGLYAFIAAPEPAVEKLSDASPGTVGGRPQLGGRVRRVPFRRGFRPHGAAGASCVAPRAARDGDPNRASVSPSGGDRSVAARRALLHLVDGWHAEAVPQPRDQIAKASSSNAAATRRLAGSSTPSS